MTGVQPESLSPRHLPARTVFQRRRELPLRTNNSLRRTYGLLRSSLHHSVEAGQVLVEADLVEALSSSRNTVRAALQLLAQEGLVTRRPKIGTTGRGSTLLPFNDVLSIGDKALAYRMRYEQLGTTIIVAPELLRTWFSLEPGASVAVIERLVLQDASAVGLSVSYVPITAEQRAQVSNSCVDVISFLEEDLGVTIGECDTIVAAATCDPETGHLLGIAEGAAILWLEDLIHDTDGRVRAIHQLRYRGDLVGFSAVARRGTLEARAG